MTDHRLESLLAFRTTNSGLQIIAPSSRVTRVTTCSASRLSVTVGISTTAIFHREIPVKPATASNWRLVIQVSESGRLTAEWTTRSARDRTPTTPVQGTDKKGFEPRKSQRRVKRGDRLASVRIRNNRLASHSPFANLEVLISRHS